MSEDFLVVMSRYPELAAFIFVMFMFGLFMFVWGGKDE